MAGANSIFYGDKLLTTGNPDTPDDRSLFDRLKLAAEPFIPAESNETAPARGLGFAL
jgi:biotin synthase-like enzyme